MKKITFASRLDPRPPAAALRAAAGAPRTRRGAGRAGRRRFAGWLGCWRLDDDLAGTGARMCITPEKSGVRLQTIVGTNKGIDELVIPDGVARPITDAECKGTEQAEWSKDGARMFRTTDVTCGKEAPRTIKSVAFMAPGPSWINVQHVSGAAAEHQRARAALSPRRQPEAGRRQQGAAAGRQHRDAHDAGSDALEHRGRDRSQQQGAGRSRAGGAQRSASRFRLNKKTLVALDEGGVHDSVIDLMVALTYPEQASSSSARGGGVVDRPASRPARAGSIRSCAGDDGHERHATATRRTATATAATTACAASYCIAVRLQLLRLRLRIRRLLSATAAGSTSADPAVIGGGPVAEPQAEGRVVNGRGYTQIRDRESEPVAAHQRRRQRRRLDGGSGGGGVSSGGYSSGSSSCGSSGGGGASAAATPAPASRCRRAAAQ